MIWRISLFLILMLTSCSFDCDFTTKQYKVQSKPTNLEMTMKFYSVGDSTYVVNPYKVDTLNFITNQGGLQINYESIVPTYIKSNGGLEKAYRNPTYRNKLTENSDTSYINVYIMDSKDKLNGFVPLPKNPENIQKYKYNDIFIVRNFKWQTLTHEIGHYLGLPHKVKCLEIMNYPGVLDCRQNLEEVEKLTPFAKKYRSYQIK